MKIKSWGNRGSLPATGKETTYYGGNTTCLEITTEAGNTIIIDAGSGIRNLGQKIIKENSPLTMLLLLTHAHWDHLMGFPFFTPAYFSKFTIYVRGGKYAKKSLQKYLKHQMEPPYFPVDFEHLNANFNFDKKDPEILKNDTIIIESIKLNHPDGGFGYKLKENGKSLIFLTDNELGHHHKDGPDFCEFINFCKDADILIHDAQYTDEEYKKTKGWGHSTFSQVLKLALEAGVKKLYLTHHDIDRSDKELDSIINTIKKDIKQKGAKLEFSALKELEEFTL